MNKELAEVIKQLADKLGTTAEHLWLVLVRQAQVEVWINVGFIVLVFLFGIVIASVAWKFRRFATVQSRWNAAEREMEACYWIPFWVAAVLWVILFGIAVGEAFEILTLVNNPEYWALQQILNKIS